ncbi:hypothetical protein L873DRAFT_1792305 [Choiromyces venosus 120613-1]|uniref:Uncharacterized protein n=1 Tax=Choiromyces venosus 120613-1 TaxID=1336337 RepID=A0A3N4JDS8_9PEZI|nr:hypothetical protein L873DRAFT_1792305 [Choiromyces venosus 120613-1]
MDKSTSTDELPLELKGELDPIRKIVRCWTLDVTQSVMCDASYIVSHLPQGHSLGGACTADQTDIPETLRSAATDDGISEVVSTELEQGAMLVMLGGEPDVPPSINNKATMGIVASEGESGG